MPNHIQNRLTFEGDPTEIQNLIDFVRTSDDQPFDFNQLIPMPGDLNIESGSFTTTHVITYLRVVNPANANTVHPSYAKMDQADFDRTVSAIVPLLAHSPTVLPTINDDTIPVDPTDAQTNESISMGQRYVSNYTNYGALTWYEWCVSNWNTKWNAYDCYVNGNVIRFNTAWSPPVPVICALAEKYPDVKITHVWACEFCGDSGGKIEYYGNNTTILLNGSIREKDAFDAYFEVYDTTPEEEGLVYNPFQDMYYPINPCAGYEDTSGMPTLPSIARTMTSAYIKGKGENTVFISMAVPNTHNFSPKDEKERNASLWILNWTK